MGAEREDLPLEDDIAEIHREVQVAVNDVQAAKNALAAANDRLDQVLSKVSGVAAAAVAFINDFRNPATPPPAPIATDVPETVLVTAPAPAEGEGADASGGADASTSEQAE